MPAHAHSVAQVQTAKRISQSTVLILDPEGEPLPGGAGSNTTAQVGSVLTYVIRFTPVPNNATRGAGGYITEYVPANTEVVGARFIDSNGNTVSPHRGPLMDDGWGPRGRHNVFDGMGLEQGSLSQLYADTGIFFSTDPRTARTPSDTFITVLNGLVVSPVPTGAGQLDNLLGFSGPPFHAHNTWDLIQATAFGANGGTVVNNGTGNTPFGFGSQVAGPETHYAFEKVASPACSDNADNDGDGQVDYPNDPECASALDDDETGVAAAPVGPWRRIRCPGSETGTGMAGNCQSCAGGYVRVGIPTNAGWDLSPDNPLPAGTNALRFAVGELVVGEEYLVEVSLRVLGLPLDPFMNRDVNCSEVFGGDAAMPQSGQDNPWRYFLPAPACVSLDLQFDLDVNKILAVQGDQLIYTITGKNLSVDPMTNVVVTDTFGAGDVDFSSVLAGPAPTVGNGLLTWPTMDLQPGDEFSFQLMAMVNEPTAAAMYYARKSRKEGPVLVFDLGGGTFDATLMHIHRTGNSSKASVEVLATGGDAFLGGADFDAALVDLLVARFERDHGLSLNDSRVVMQRLAFAAESAKKTLSTEQETQVALNFVGQKDGKMLDLRYKVTRPELESCTAPLIEKCVGIADELMGRAGLKKSDLAQVVMVGGQTRMPAIQKRLTRSFGAEPSQEVHPELGVAAGAALLARGMGELLDVVPMGINLMASGVGSKEIIPANVPVPLTQSHPLGARPPHGQPLVLTFFEAVEATSLEREEIGIARVPFSWLEANPGALTLESAMDADFRLKLSVLAGRRRFPLTLSVRPRAPGSSSNAS